MDKAIQEAIQKSDGTTAQISVSVLQDVLYTLSNQREKIASLERSAAASFRDQLETIPYDRLAD